MPKQKPKTVDAQVLKKSLVAVAQRIGRRKRMTAGQVFELMIDAMNR